MASTYTTNTGLEKIATGEKSGTWGDITNTNFDIIDRAMNGSVSLSLSGASSTLSTNDGALSDGQNKVLVLTGSPNSGHIVTISPNDAEKVYVVKNDTAQNIQFSQGSGSNATINAGQTGIIFSDGAGSGAAVTNISQKFGMNDVSISGGDADFTTLQVGSVDVVDLSSSQTLTNKTLTSPDLGGTPTATTASSGDASTRVATTAFVDTAVTTATGSLGTISTQDANNVTLSGGTVSGVTISGSTIDGDSLAAAYPVGSIYMNASSSTNPATLLGFGTWVAFGAGRMLVGLSSGDSDFDTAEETGGSKTHTLTIDEMPAHNHKYALGEYSTPGNYDYGQNQNHENYQHEDDGPRGYQCDTQTVGGGSAHSIMNPYIVVYMWKRTA